MPRGPHTRTLTRSQIERLEKFRRAYHEGAPHGYSFALLRTAMGARFSPVTLTKALQGLPVLDLHHSYIVEWIERYLEAKPPKPDGKAAASGERDELQEFGDRGRSAQDAVDKAIEDAEKTTGTARTVRGSR